MRRSLILFPCAALVAVVACSSSDPPTQNGGVVQIADWLMNPQTVQCGLALTNPLSNNAVPDTVSVQVQMVNTTDTDVTLVAAGTSGTVVVATESADLQASVLNLNNLPFTPQPALIQARTGDLTIRVSLPMRPYCNTKPPGYNGTHDILISVRMTTNSGQYVGLPKSLRVIWD